MINEAQKQNHLIYLILTGTLFFSFTRTINGQSKKEKPEIIQSTFYDAINLYFAIKNYSAYPVYLGSRRKSELTENPVPANKPNPGFGNIEATTTPSPQAAAPIDTVFRYYRLVESMTGKTLLDSFKCTDDAALKALMDRQYKFASNDDQQNFVDSVLARNAGMRGAAHADIIIAYKANTYILQNGKYSMSGQLDPKQPLAYNQPSSTLNLEGGALPSLNATRLVEGLADFYIDRVNDELNDAFFIQLQNALNKKPELGIIFPQTLKSLNTIEITKYNASLNAIKLAYTNDMKEILANLTMLATLKKYQDLISQYPELTILFASCDMIDMINKQKAPAEILYQVSTADYITKIKSNNYSSSILLAALISGSLRDIRINDENKNEAGWIDQDKLNYLKNNKDVFALFMGLFAQNAANINFTEGGSMFSVKDQLITNKDKVLAGQYIVYNFNTTVKKIKDNTDRISGLRNGTNKSSDYISGYLAIVNNLLDFSEQCLDVLPTSAETQKIRIELKKVQKDYLPMVKQANTILSDIEAKEYCTALYQSDTLLIQILSHLKMKNDSFIVSNNKKTAGESDKTRKKVMAAENVLLKKENDSIRDLKEDFIKYGMFIATIATAKTSEDVKDAISAFALPKGSSRIKKENRFSVGLNSYVGVSYALNSSYGTTKLPDAEWVITAPMGLAINILGDCKWNSSLTLYAGIIDIGAAFTYKINSDSTIKSDIQLKQIFSPSVGLVYGFPVIKKYNIPLSIGISSQWGPTLHKVAENGNSVLPMMAQRTNFFIAVDIPIVNFHVSRK